MFRLLGGLALASPTHLKSACIVRNLWQALAMASEETAPITSQRFLVALQETKSSQLSKLPAGLTLFTVAPDLVPRSSCSIPGTCSFMEALLWSQSQLESVAHKEPRHHHSSLAAAYLIWALDLAKSSPSLCSIYSGLPITDCRLLSAQHVDKATIYMLLAHFKVRFTWRNDTHSVAMRNAILTLLETSNPERSKQAYRRLLAKTFSRQQPCGVLIQSPYDDSGNAGVSFLNSLSPFGGLQQGTAQRFLEILGLSESEAKNTARKYCTPEAMIKASACRLPERARLDLFKNLCVSMTAEALRTRHTRIDIVDAFCASCIASVRLLIEADPSVQEACFWISWLEKKLQGFLHQLIQTEASNYAERALPSPQRKI